MRYSFVCPKDREHPGKEVEHSINEDHPVLHCGICGEVMIRDFKAPLMVGRTPDPGGMIVDYLEYNRKRKKAGMPRYSPFKIKRPPE